MMANPNEYLDQLVGLAKLQVEAARQMLIEREREMERARGIKILRLPLLIATGANPFLITPDQSQAVGGPWSPDEGYEWSLKFLVIEGLTRGASPDTVQVLRAGGMGQRIIWELNGNQYAQTWGNGEIIIKPGETIGFQSVGTFAATGKIIIHGHAWQVPAEHEWKLL